MSVREIIERQDLEAFTDVFHPQPPPELVPHLHQIFLLRDEQIVELRDFPDRASALEAYERMRELEEREQ